MNNGFKCAYFAELGKLLKKKRTLKLIISLAIIIVVFTLLFRFVYSLLEDVSGVALSEIEFADTQEELDALKAGYEEYKIASENLTKNKLIDTTIYSYKAQIAAGQFLVDNNISASSIRSFGTVSLSSKIKPILSSNNSTNFTLFKEFSSFSIIVSILGLLVQFHLYQLRISISLVSLSAKIKLCTFSNL